MKLHCVKCGRLRNTVLYVYTNSDDPDSEKQVALRVSSKILNDVLHENQNLTDMMIKKDASFHSFCSICMHNTVFKINDNKKMTPVSFYKVNYERN